MILVYILMSWLPNLRENFIGELLGKLVEPFLAPFRKIIPPLFGTIDISPIIAIVALRFAVVGLNSLVAMAFG
ncbi:YggT family protein [Paenibacillus sp. FSL K6-1096]|uniref:YggT family protein n=1 Tax=Paenibacillus sp. FSL K6-1096 TaxID=2921460 RepID=UPI0030ED8CD1